MYIVVIINYIILTGSPSFIKLDVTQNSICDEGMLVIADDLQHYNTLSELLVENCNLSAKGTCISTVLYYICSIIFCVYNIRLVNTSALSYRCPGLPCILSSTFADLAYLAIHTYPVYCTHLPSLLYPPTQSYSFLYLLHLYLVYLYNY